MLWRGPILVKSIVLLMLGVVIEGATGQIDIHGHIQISQEIMVE